MSTCADYALGQWCTPWAGYGVGWAAGWGTFAAQGPLPPTELAHPPSSPTAFVVGAGPRRRGCWTTSKTMIEGPATVYATNGLSADAVCCACGRNTTCRDLSAGHAPVRAISPGATKQCSPSSAFFFRV